MRATRSNPRLDAGTGRESFEQSSFSYGQAEDEAQEQCQKLWATRALYITTIIQG
jgi:hypothetical protein